MPVYEYKCGCDPDNIVSKERLMASTEPIYLCGYCGERLQRHYSPVGVKFVGKGFYKTDSV